MISPQAFRRWVVALPLALAMSARLQDGSGCGSQRFNAVGRTNSFPSEAPIPALDGERETVGTGSSGS